MFFFFKQKTAYEMRISDWSSDVCSSDLVSYDQSKFIAQSIQEVFHALMVALALVIGVIFLFLRSWRATLIPAVAIPVSVVGSFIVIGALGYSINVLTLLALVLAIGLVVDDAIEIGRASCRERVCQYV